MSRINHLILADGRSLDVSSYALDHTEFSRAVSAFSAAASATKQLAFNLYNASAAPFCLGARAHASLSDARSKASTDNYFSSFLVNWNAGERRMSLVGGNTASASQVRYALFDGEKFKKPAYESTYEARRNASSRDVIVEIGVRGTTVVSIKMVI